VKVDTQTLQAKALAIIRGQGSIGETTLLKMLFPEPEYPKTGSESEIESWRTAFEAWKDNAYGSATIKYRDCYCGLVSQAAIALAKSGEIRTTNNGYNCYTYHAVKQTPRYSLARNGRMTVQ